MTKIFSFNKTFLVLVSIFLISFVLSASGAKAEQAVYPQNNNFSQNLDGWTFSTDYGGLCVPAVTCNLVNSTFQSTDGSNQSNTTNDGYLSIGFGGVSSLGTSFIQTSTSPIFEVGDTTNKTAQMSLRIRNHFGGLLPVDYNGYTRLNLVDVSTPNTPTIVASRMDLNNDDDSWSYLLKSSPLTLQSGHSYRIQIVTNLNGGVGVLRAGSFDYDDPKLVLSDTGSNNNEGDQTGTNQDNNGSGNENGNNNNGIGTGIDNPIPTPTDPNTEKGNTSNKPTGDYVVVKPASGTIMVSKLSQLKYINKSKAKKECKMINKKKSCTKAKVLNIRIGADVLFKTNSFKLNSRAKTEVRKLAKKMKKYRVKSITITGNTDSVGSVASNKKLALNRAKAVNAEIKKAKFKKVKIMVRSNGEKKPIRSNKSSEGRTKNRNVQLRLVLR